MRWLDLVSLILALHSKISLPGQFSYFHLMILLCLYTKHEVCFWNVYQQILVFFGQAVHLFYVSGSWNLCFYLNVCASKYAMNTICPIHHFRQVQDISTFLNLLTPFHKLPIFTQISVLGNIWFFSGKGRQLIKQ